MNLGIIQSVLTNSLCNNTSTRSPQNYTKEPNWRWNRYWQDRSIPSYDMLTTHSLSGNTGTQKWISEPSIEHRKEWCLTFLQCGSCKNNCFTTSCYHKLTHTGMYLKTKRKYLHWIKPICKNSDAITSENRTKKRTN